MNNDNPKKYINPYLGGTLLGIVLFSAYFFTGAGLGASGAISRLQAFIMDIFASGHVDNVSTFAHTAGGSKNPLANAGVFMLAGTILGGFISGLVNRRVKLETNKGSQISDRTRWILAFFGGMIMVYGARMSRGCTSGQALSGGAVMSVGSWAFMIAVFGGGYLVAYFFRKLWIDSKVKGGE